MSSVFWTPQADEDLASIYAYITQTSERYAEVVIHSLIASVGRLGEFPESGRMVPELQRPGIREVVWRRYRLVYRHVPERQQVHVLALFRSERELPHLQGPLSEQP